MCEADKGDTILRKFWPHENTDLLEAERGQHTILTALTAPVQNIDVIITVEFEM